MMSNFFDLPQCTQDCNICTILCVSLIVILLRAVAIKESINSIKGLFIV